MGQKARVARTPTIVRVAIAGNLVLLAVALTVSRRMAEGADESGAAAMLFVAPMLLMVALGAGAAIRAYLLAARDGLRVRWIAFLPLALCVLGIALALLMIYTDPFPAEPTSVN